MQARVGDAAGAETLLAEAYDYVLSGWCQGADALDESGRPIEPASAFARKWSAIGALERAWRRSGEEAGVDRQAFEQARLALTAAVNDVPQAWNDRPGRHHSEVLSALAEALQLVGVAGKRTAPEPVEELLA
ncbi:MAG: DUF6197 family protein [Gaiellaceae bacterium]